MRLLSRLFEWLRSGEAAFFAARKESPMIDESIRLRIVNRANAAVGLSAAPEHLEQFAAFLGGPGEARATCIAMANYRNPKTGRSVSACGTVRRAIERDCEIDDPHNLAPYRTSMAITDQLTFARAHGAWVDAKPGLRPKPGDEVGVALFGPDAGEHGHVFTCTGYLPDGRMISVDGGQVTKPKGKDPGGHQMIARKIRTWVERNGKIFDTSRLEDPESGFDSYDEREVSGWVDVEKLPVRGGGRAVAPSSPPVLVPGPSKSTELEFIDLSGANGKPDFVRIRASGITGVWFHGLEGNENVDAAVAKLMPEVNAARAAGLLTGVYQEVYPRHGGRASDAEEQARQLAELHHRLACELLPMAVHEDVTGTAIRYDAQQRAECIDCARTHRARLRTELGREGIFYTGPGYWDHVSKGLDVSDFADALLMCADYELIPKPRLPRGFRDVALWQYAGGAGVIGHVDGVATVVDRTRLLGRPLDAIRA